jgi:5-methylcytosine-specific restriction endonuclease McrA
MLRFEIFQRDNFTCQYCGRTKKVGIKLVIDHKVPVSKGGTDSPENLITACDECNLGKSNKLI